MVLLVEPHLRVAQEEINLAQLISGDKAEWNRFVHTTSPIIFTLVERTLSSAGFDRADVYDIVQDIFLHLCKDDFRVLKTTYTAWNNTFPYVPHALEPLRFSEIPL